MVYLRLKKTYTKKKKTKKYKMLGGDEINNIPICIYAHSDVFDILEILVEYLHKVFKNTSQKIYIFTNIKYNKETPLIYESILYDDKIPYNKRIAYCLKHIKCEYFIISQESDILVNYSKDTIHKLVDTMKANNIDSIDLKQHASSNKDIKVTDTLSITNINKHPYVFNVQPRLWKLTSAIMFYSSIPDKTYKTMESSNANLLLKTKQTTYGIFSKNIIISTRNFNVLPEYKYIHITGDGKFINPNKDIIDPSIKEEYVNIYNKYIKNSKRGLLPYMADHA
jgi:hypothetical protein